MSNIKCRVEECHYNRGGEICFASTIEVKARTHDHMISASDDTACETFIPLTKSQRS